MRKVLVVLAAFSVQLTLAVPTAAGHAAVPAASRVAATDVGAPGAGDRYFPLAGNGGYDVQHYTLDLRYRPSTDRLAGVATIDATATQTLRRFNLDLSGLRVASVLVNDLPAHWARRGQELIIRPRHPLAAGGPIRTVVTYASVPQTLDPSRALPAPSGFFHTDDGSLVAGEPKVAATWFPVNDHPSDKASYTFRISVPQGRAVVANGELVGRHTVNGWTTWHWEAAEPMAPYLATANAGRWRFFRDSHQGIEILDALDRRLFRPLVEPRTGEGFAWSAIEDRSYQRLTRTVTVPTEGARLTFSVNRHLESFFDFFTVEARTVGEDDWTTLPDLNGHTERFPGGACPDWLELHPFLRHYMAPVEDRPRCRPRGTTGQWHAATFESRGYERWAVDLSAYAGRQVELFLTVVHDEKGAGAGAFVDDIRISTGEGSTSLEPDQDPADGWHAAAAPPGSPPQDAGWTIGTVDQAPEHATIALRSLARQGEVIDFLEGFFGRYPFSQAGGIVDRNPELFFALENQTRPIYSQFFFGDTLLGEIVVVHELAHQWVGDSLTVKKWRHIWLNEGFATYTEWLWLERQGLVTPQEVFDNVYRFIRPRDGFWELAIGDPGPRHLLEFPVYLRGAMTLQALRMTVGDDAFFRILRRWTHRQEGELVTTAEFVRLAERVSHRDLDQLFQDWLFTTERPPRPTTAAAARQRPSSGAPAMIDKLLTRPSPHVAVTGRSAAGAPR